MFLSVWGRQQIYWIYLLMYLVFIWYFIYKCKRGIIVKMIISLSATQLCSTRTSNIRRNRSQFLIVICASWGLNILNPWKIHRKHRSVEKATWETERDNRYKYPQLSVDSSATPFLPWAIFPMFVTQRWVMGKLVSIVMIKSRRYRTSNKKNLGSKNFFAITWNFPT